ncbi:alpha-L-fucosidase [Streptomyces dysideae]|uniref:alpha-L-fucosidase n=1 Tax=Streptomyces dysideae TaxID=909626 RepID=A0A117RYH0_9ACTN|nr:alpha-L-fucosidase [Streptomyces dysideae]
MIYTPTWSSVDRHVPAPEWFQDAKFGIYHHWGAFSVPAFNNEWYPRDMYIPDHPVHRHHIQTYGDPSTWPYHRFIDGGHDKSGRFVRFAPKLRSAGGLFDPDEWAQLIADAGARFAGPVAEHHDGFSMWDSRVNEWNSVAKGPRLNLLDSFARAYRAQGLKVLVAMHHAFHFTGFFDHVPPQSEPTLRKLYGQLGPAAENRLWLDKLREVIDLARPDILWQDVNLDQVDESTALEFLAHYYNRADEWGSEVVATYKDGFNDKGQVYDYERGGPAEVTRPYWLTDDIVARSTWCHTTDITYHSLEEILHSLIDRVSKNGNMLLNISPTADGAIPEEQRTILQGIGGYLRRFGESLYGTRAWTVHGEGPTTMGGGSFTEAMAGTNRDIRFTRNKQNTVLYATALGWPVGSLAITTLTKALIDLGSLRSVHLLGPMAGDYVPLRDHRQDENGLHITLPSTAPFSAPAYTVKLTFTGPIPELRS